MLPIPMPVSITSIYRLPLSGFLVKNSIVYYVREVVSPPSLDWCLNDICLIFRMGGGEIYVLIGVTPSFSVILSNLKLLVNPDAVLF